MPVYCKTKPEITSDLVVHTQKVSQDTTLPSYVGYNSLPIFVIYLATMRVLHRKSYTTDCNFFVDIAELDSLKNPTYPPNSFGPSSARHSLFVPEPKTIRDVLEMTHISLSFAKAVNAELVDLSAMPHSNSATDLDVATGWAQLPLMYTLLSEKYSKLCCSFYISNTAYTQYARKLNTGIVRKNKYDFKTPRYGVSVYVHKDGALRPWGLPYIELQSELKILFDRAGVHNTAPESVFVCPRKHMETIELPPYSDFLAFTYRYFYCSSVLEGKRAQSSSGVLNYTSEWVSSAERALMAADKEAVALRATSSKDYEAVLRQGLVGPVVLSYAKPVESDNTQHSQLSIWDEVSESQQQAVSIPTKKEVTRHPVEKPVHDENIPDISGTVSPDAASLILLANLLMTEPEFKIEITGVSKDLSVSDILGASKEKLIQTILKANRADLRRQLEAFVSEFMK